MKNDAHLLIAAGLFVCLVGAFIGWRRLGGGTALPPQLVEVVDASISMRTDCDRDLRIITGAIQSMPLKQGASLTIIRTGDRSTNQEPQLVFGEWIPVAPKGPLAGHAKGKADMEAFLGRAKAACRSIPQTATSPIIKAVRRGLVHLKGLGCTAGSGCVLIVDSDLQDNDEFRTRPKLSKTAASLDNTGIRVVLCGFTQTRDDGFGVKTDTLLAVWTAMFVEPVSVAPFCEGGL